MFIPTESVSRRIIIFIMTALLLAYGQGLSAQCSSVQSSLNQCPTYWNGPVTTCPLTDTFGASGCNSVLQAMPPPPNSRVLLSIDQTSGMCMRQLSEPLNQDQTSPRIYQPTPSFGTAPYTQSIQQFTCPAFNQRVTEPPPLLRRLPILRRRQGEARKDGGWTSDRASRRLKEQNAPCIASAKLTTKYILT